jgi:Bcr/CflA subfamily drug resistance transporter
MKQKALIPLILILSILVPFAVDTYVPSLPAMSKYFFSSPSKIQLTITMYLIGIGFSQILWGPFSDRFGRKKILLFSIPFFFIGSIFCIFANSIHLLWIGRVFQGIGLGALLFTPGAMTSDAFQGNMVNKVSSYLSFTYSFIPIIAPIIGGHLQHYFNWQSTFVFLLILSILIYILIIFAVPETHKPSTSHRLIPKKILKNYYWFLKNKNFMASVIACSLVWGLILSFSLLCPFIFEKQLSLSPIQYGYSALFVGLGFMLGSFINAKAITFCSEKIMTLTGISLIFVFSIFLFVFMKIFSPNIYLIIIPIFIVITGAGISNPNFFAILLKQRPELGGVAVSLAGTFLLIINIFITSIISFLHPHKVSSLALAYISLSVLIIICFLLVSKQKEIE